MRRSVLPLCISLAALWPALGAQTLERAAELLRSEDPFDRQRGEVELRGLGPDALPELARLSESQDRLFRFRAGKVFSDALETLLRDLESEQQALYLDRNELAGFRDLAEAFALRRDHGDRLEEMAKANPDFIRKIAELLPLSDLEELEKAFKAGDLPALKEETVKEIAKLRAKEEEWKKADPSFEERIRPILRLTRLEAAGLEGRELTELEEIRRKELEERIAEREPRVADLVKKVEAIGPAAMNGLLARRIGARQRMGSFYRGVGRVEGAGVGRVEEARKDGVPSAEDAELARKRLDLVLPEQAAEFEAKRYHRSLLWVQEIESRGPLADPCKRALEAHLAATLADLADPEHIVRERAEDELYLLGERGRAALEKEIARDPGRAVNHKFLLGLLRWRIRPSVHARVGIDFEEYPSLGFRERRRKIFSYANAAGEEAIPTLRAIVMDDSLEPSFFVKMPAATALVGLRDMTGFNYLAAKHPEMTLKKPEVSRELIIIQGLEYIRENNHKKAVEEFRKLLDEYPFDFRGNYHIAFAYLLLKNYSKSIHHFEIARRINPQDQLTLYNLACAYALSGKKTEALDALERSVDAGFDDYVHMEKDPDLESLREDSRYQQLMERMRKGN